MVTRVKSKVVLLWIVIVFLFGCKVNTLSELPAYTDYKTPLPAPSAPGEPFTPTMSGSAGNNTPLCAEWTRSAGPDESLIITGADFTSYKHRNAGKDSRFRVYGPDGSLRDASILRAERNKAVITIGKEMPKWSMYLIWPGNRAGYGKPIAVNKTEAWWIGPEKATRGNKVSVYGRNLSTNNDTISSHIYIKSLLNGGRWVDVVNVNPYRVEFLIPPDLPNGEYEVWAHNGHGAKYGWSGPLKLTIRNDVKWTETVFNVKNYGARGDGLTDDTDAIYQALLAAKKSMGSTVYFPKGIYMINKMLAISDNTRWIGGGSAITFIKCGSNYFSNNAMIVGRVKNVEIRDLTFDTNGNFKGKGPEFREEAINLDGSSGVKLNNLVFSCKGYSALRLNHAKDILIENSKFIGNKSFLGSCSNLIIDKCDFYLTHDAEMALHSWDGTNISMTNSTCQDFDNTDINNGAGWGKGRFFHSAGNGGSTRHTYLGNNRTYDLAVRSIDVDQNSGEQFLWEGFSAKWWGSVVSSTGSKTILKQFSKSFPSLKVIAIITKGRGSGQSRWITAVDGSTITLEKPWNVPPDRSSTIAIGYFADKIVMYKNNIDGKAGQVYNENITASTGIQPYGGVVNFIADRNTITEVRTGIANWSTQHSIGIDPNYFNLFTNNSISICRWGILNALQGVKRPDIGLMGTTFRKNTVNTALEAGVAVLVSPSNVPLMENILYEHNSFLNVPRGVFFKVKPAKSVISQTFYKNTFRSNAKFPAIELSPEIKLRDNTYTGFSKLYTGTATGSAIEAPFHVVEIPHNASDSISAIPFTIWNTGTPKLNFEFKSHAKWLKVSATSETIQNEGSRVVTLMANPAGLGAGVHRANLSISAGSEVKTYTVLFKVTPQTGEKIALKAEE